MFTFSILAEMMTPTAPLLIVSSNSAAAASASMSGTDEIQIYIMVWMTFLGAAVVTWRNQHLRMDVLVQLLPRPVRAMLRVAELALLATLAGFVLVQSSLYAQQMFRLGRTSDMAGVPMWIPHGAVAVGFALILIVTIWRLIGLARQSPQTTSEGQTAP